MSRPLFDIVTTTSSYFRARSARLRSSSSSSSSSSTRVAAVEPGSERAGVREGPLHFLPPAAAAAALGASPTLLLPGSPLRTGWGAGVSDSQGAGGSSATREKGML